MPPVFSITSVLGSSRSIDDVGFVEFCIDEQPPPPKYDDAIVIKPPPTPIAVI